jgi:hypothetical protein
MPETPQAHAASTVLTTEDGEPLSGWRPKQGISKGSVEQQPAAPMRHDLALHKAGPANLLAD